MNGDASTTQALLDDDGRNGNNGNDGRSGRAQTPCERSLSGFVLLLGLRRRLKELAHHTVYFSADYRAEFSQLFDARRFPDDPTVYVCAPSRTDPRLAPEGGETLFVMANAPATDAVWDESQIESARSRVFERLSKGDFPDIASDIVVSDVWTPGRFADDISQPRRLDLRHALARLASRLPAPAQPPPARRRALSRRRQQPSRRRHAHRPPLRTHHVRTHREV